MANEFRRNHYVPQWYQRRFIPPGQQKQELFYLDLKPESFSVPNGQRHHRHSVKRQGPRKCFVENDLYTATIEGIESTEVERIFFGEIDRSGKRAVEYFAGFAHPSVDGHAYQALMQYMSTQRLRTPKGLGWLRQQVNAPSKEHLLQAMMTLRKVYGAIWTECVWQIADASDSATKFIITDHPVTVYNRRCGPRSQWCRGFGDPDIRYHATHTLFPLSIDKILILTNLSWVRNPYQSEMGVRPNPNLFRTAIIKFTDIQVMRRLWEEEVRQINFIMKSRALKFIAAAEREWLYPEQHVSKSQWREFGHGYLLMPDPRPVHLGGETMWGGGSGPGGAMDAYGRVPGDPDYNLERTSRDEARGLYRFKGEFARLFGPRRRGRTFSVMQLDKEIDDEEYHQYHLSLEKHKR